MNRVLELLFTTATNKTKTFTIEAPIQNVSPEVVRAAMTQMIASGIFNDVDHPLQAIKGARYVERNVVTIIE